MIEIPADVRELPDAPNSVVAANTSFILQGDPSLFDRARRATRERLEAR